VRLWGEQTSANFFSVLGVAARSGRAYTSADGRADVVVLSYRAWQTHYGGAPSIVGQTVRLNGRSYEILGVMPAGFRGAAPAGMLHDFWFPVDEQSGSAALRNRRATQFEVFGRRAAGVGGAAAAAALRLEAQRIRREYPEVP